MSADIDRQINDYLTGLLLRYFRTAVAVEVEQPDIDNSHDLDLLRLHWAISGSIKRLVAHLLENPHEIQAVLEFRTCEDDSRVRGRLDSRATVMKQMIASQPTVMVSHEPSRNYRSGPNHLLTWVLEQSWRLVTRFGGTLPRGASYLEEVEGCALGLETIRRFEPIRQAAKQLNLARRPSPHAVWETSRSRRPLYVLASKAYRTLQSVESGDEAAIAEMLNETLLGPLDVWRRFELAVGLGMARSLAAALSRRMSLGFIIGGDPIAQVGSYELHWQSRTEAWREPPLQPAEKVVSKLLRNFGLTEGPDRPDLVVRKGPMGEVISIAEVKYFDGVTSDGTDALRAAVTQLVRYARGYRDFERLDGLLDHSIIALSCMGKGRNSTPRPLGVPVVVDFEGILQQELDGWARNLVTTRDAEIPVAMTV